jgi:hypothetical protein
LLDKLLARDFENMGYGYRNINDLVTISIVYKKEGCRAIMKLLRLHRRLEYMTKGGKREGSGAKPKWKHGKTTVIRVPIAIADEILDFAKKLDSGNNSVLNTQFYGLDLSLLNVPQIRNKRFVFLQDILKLGYEIYPLSLAEDVRKEINLSKQASSKHLR